MTQTLDVPLTLLLIEDDAGDAFLVEELLQQAEVPPKLIWVRSLEESRARLTSDIQCVLVDLSLPDAHGLEALEEVLRMAPHAAVLVLTGTRDVHMGVAAVQAGAQDYLVKQDVDARLLARAVRYSMERKRADIAQINLVQAQLTAKENARLERGLLPNPILRTTTLEHTSRYRPGRERALLAGDFFDTVETADGAVHMVVGDVCGHGPDEAALGVALRIAWRTLVLAGQSDNALLTVMDTLLKTERKSPEIFTTLCTVTISPDQCQARMYVVGHPSPLLLRGDGDPISVSASPSGPPLGIFSGIEWTPVDVRLGEDWSLLVYTDGLIEATVGDGSDLLGTEGLIKIIKEHGQIDLDRIIQGVTEINDDVAAVLVSRKG
ncbi:PP2C family protein-serine/threonine phosphatase [Nonomuraea sp. NPDC050663]|uniref:PP2C family protein-serine/threonine phosphatase n=1 Tax=Nonomuraea sp. NPDC050663 TaxID=3364370 RepID=UPI0037ABFBB0